MVQKVSKTLLILILSYALLVATHLGEFWPFSIFPMFSQTGKTWEKVIVREIGGDTLKTSVAILDAHSLPGKPFILRDTKINQNDLSNFIRLNKEWDEERKEILNGFFQNYLENKTLMIIKVKGNFDSHGDSMRITYQPFGSISDDSIIIY